MPDFARLLSFLPAAPHSARSGTPTRRAIFRRTGAAGAIALALLAGIAPAMADSLQKKVNSALAGARLGAAHVGVSILDCSNGQELVEVRSGSPKKGSEGEGFIPASNLKLFTSGAAFLVLGNDYEFQTKVIADGDRLIIVGAGDPAFAEPVLLDQMHMGVDQFVDKLVESAREAGITGLREVVVDDRVFDREYVHPDWPKEQLSRSYCAEVSGMNFHGNVLNVYVSPGPGKEALAKAEPSGSWLTIRRNARTVKEGNTEVWLERESGGAADSFTFKLHGTVRSAISEPVQVTVDQPGLMFAKVLAEKAGKEKQGQDNKLIPGLGVNGAPIAARLVGVDETIAFSAAARTLTVVRTPISVALERCNVDSENLYAESFCKLLGNKVTGQPGTWASGTAVVRMQVKDKVGAEAAAQLVLADGSGLSRNNRITPGVMTRWLRAVAGSPDGDAFVRSLALAGAEGTLKKRFKGVKLHNEVRAKSGFIRGVRTLSGYVTSSGGQRIAFSVLVDNVPGDGDAKAKAFHEDVVEAIDQYLYEKGRVAGAPTPGER
jgi:D-alanyl-D-alanine carboxypeptidase/D-alanyl-D-alanine-endopeptidase (penicillin-binding protein 4)